MPPAIIAAGIGVAGSVAGAAISSSAAKSAAKSQAAASQQQIANNNANRDYVRGLEQPAIDRGNAAGATYAGLLGLGDSPAATKALDTWRGSVGYQDLLKTGLGAVNANAYARGFGDSGATYKALQDRGMNIANQNQSTYMANLGTLINSGRSAIGNISNVATNTTIANNQAVQGASDASQAATMASATGWQTALRNLISTGQNFASSYGAPNAGAGGYIQPQPGALGATGASPGVARLYGGLNPGWA